MQALFTNISEEFPLQIQMENKKYVNSSDWHFYVFSYSFYECVKIRHCLDTACAHDRPEEKKYLVLQLKRTIFNNSLDMKVNRNIFLGKPVDKYVSKGIVEFYLVIEPDYFSNLHNRYSKSLFNNLSPIFFNLYFIH